MIHRRRFVMMTGGSMAAVAITSAQAVENVATRGPATQHRRVSKALGTEVSITACHASQDVAKTALTAAFAELEKIEKLMSLFRAYSQICRLNRFGKLPRPHPYFLAVLRFARQISQ